MKRLQNILVVPRPLTEKQFLKLKEWWGNNYPEISKGLITPRKLVIPLNNHYIDCELRTIWL